MTPDKIADSVERLGELSHLWIEADHGRWTVTLVWGGSGAFIGRGDSLTAAYRSVLDAIIIAGHSAPGLHDLAARVSPGIVGLPVECHACPVMERWTADRHAGKRPVAAG